MHYVVLVLAGLIRLIPHPWNFTPIGSIGLFAGTWCNPKIAWLVPLIPLFIGDMITGFYDPFIMVFVYAGFALSAVIGRLFLARKRTALRFGGAITVNAIVFYLVSNFPVWLTYYPRTAAGLVECYVKGLPYMGNMVLGDTVFVAILFGLYFLALKLTHDQHAVAAP